LCIKGECVTQILNGERAITGDTALRLGHFFGTSPEFWLNLRRLVAEIRFHILRIYCGEKLVSFGD